jgi:hypothetical protein
MEVMAMFYANALNQWLVRIQITNKMYPTAFLYSDDRELECRIDDLRQKLDEKRALADKLRTEHKIKSDVYAENRERSLQKQIQVPYKYLW